MNTQAEVLIAIMNNKQDFAIFREKRWYRVPVGSANRRLKKRWPPKWLALYQTKAFGEEKYQVNYYAEVVQIEEVARCQLFPNEPNDEKSRRKYFKLQLGEIRKLPMPIISRTWRRIVFISTTWAKFVNAAEINDLYDDSPLEDRLWTEFKRRRIPAERQEFVTIKDQHYALDFAIYCGQGNIDVETDGDTWHANPEKAASDRVRDNALGTAGWRVLRFGTNDIHERADAYCIETVTEAINRLGGIKEGRYLRRKIYPESQDIYQMGLFDDL